MSRLRAAWDRLWFAPAPTETLGLVRLFVGLTLVLKFTGVWGIYRGWGALNLRLPFHDGLQHGRFRLPVPGFDWLPPMTAASQRLWDGLALALAVLLTLGLGTRAVSVGLALLLLYALLESQFNYLHHVNVYVWVICIFALSPMGDHYSLDAVLRRLWARARGLRPVRPIRPILYQRMLQVFLSVLYLTTTIGKLTPDWFDGSIFGALANGGFLKGPFKATLLGLFPPMFMAWWTLFAESLLAVGLWHPKSRRVTAWCGVALHLGIDAMMNVTTFSYLMISLYLSFASPATGQTSLSVDPGQPLSRGLGLLVRALDWTQRIRLVSAPGPMRLHSPEGEVLGGVHALGRVLGLLPLTFMAGLWVDLGLGLLRRLRPPAPIG
ncbi:MAG: HTTM domain-containing protein [Deltaproteobacteria bacterium]|nr:HTTM domain-containing protein [Deltaproteobacteria bacterium]